MWILKLSRFIKSISLAFCCFFQWRYFIIVHKTIVLMTPELLYKSGKFALLRRRSNYCRLLSNKVFNYGHRRQKHPLNRNWKIAENFSLCHINSLCHVQFIKFPSLFRPQKNTKYSHSPFVNNELTFPRCDRSLFSVKTSNSIYRNGPSFTKGRIFVNPVNICHSKYSWQHSLFVLNRLYKLIWKKSNFHKGEKENISTV